MLVYFWIFFALLSACSGDDVLNEDEPHVIADMKATANGHESVTIEATLQIAHSDEVSFYTFTCAEGDLAWSEKEGRNVEWIQNNRVEVRNSTGEDVPHHMIFHPRDRSFMLWFWNLPEDGQLNLTYTFSEVQDPRIEHYTSFEKYVSIRQPSRDFNWTIHSNLPFAQFSIEPKPSYGPHVGSDGVVSQMLIELSNIGPLVEKKSRDTQGDAGNYVMLLVGLLSVIISLVPISLRAKLVTYSFVVASSQLYWNWTWFVFHRYLFDGYTNFLGVTCLFLALGAITVRACQYDTKMKTDFYRPINLFILYLSIPLFIGWMIDEQKIMYSSILGFGFFVIWMRRNVAIQFGIGLEKIIATIHTQRLISFQELAAQYRVDETFMIDGMKAHAHGRVCIDYENKTLYSMQHLASLKEHHFCISCGGVTKEVGQELMACPYCDRVYATPLEAKNIDKHPPTVSIISDFFFSFSLTSLYALVPILLFIAYMVFIKDVSDILPFVLYIGGPSIPAFVLGLFVLASFPLYRVCALISWPLLKILPGSLSPFGPRELRHFGRNKKDLGSEIKIRGEMTRADVVEFYETSQAAAYEMMMFASMDDDFDAVYDKLADKIVSRDVYRTLAHSSSCSQCGGVYGIISGAIQCHHCGHRP